MKPAILHAVPVWSVLALAALAGPVAAHEVRPAYLEIHETAGGRFDILWKQPAKPGLRLGIDPVLPETCRTLADGGFEATVGAAVRRWSVDCGEGGLRGRYVSVEGLERTMIDVLVEIRFANGKSFSRVLRPERPGFVVDAGQSVAAAGYLRLGIDHLLFGFDHILFVIGLTLLVRDRWALLKTCTAFTLAHSITLGLSALDVVRLSQGPVEAVIALSILFLAAELARRPGSRPTVTARFPWAIAFSFGLLHGFGFAGALAEIGLPHDALALALFLFNVGVEIGQLVIIAAMLAGLLVLRWSPIPIGARITQLPVYGMGIVSAYWFLERIWRIA